MEQKIESELQDIASKINAKILVTTATLNDTWRNELITLNLPNEVLNRLWLETSFFGAYLLLKRFSMPLGEEKSDFINNAVRDAFIFTVPAIVFGDTKSENADLKNYITSEYDRMLEMYRNYKGVDVRILFRDLVRDIFNTVGGSKVKFIDNTFGNRLKLKTAFILSALGGNKEFIEMHKNEIYLPNENLIAFSDSAVRAFAGVSQNDMNG